MMRLFAALLLCLSAHPLFADQRSDPIAEVFQSWLTERDGKGALAVFEKGELLAEYDLGLDPNARAELASLSKAITAICIAQLVDEGRIGWSDTFASIYGSGPHVSIAELVTHTSGLAPDGTQLGMSLWFGEPDGRGKDVLKLIELRQGNSAARGDFHYNNENYALLGLVIEKVAQTSVADHCRQSSLAPAGVTAGVSEFTGAFLSWGGWTMSPVEYGKFVLYWFGEDTDLARAPLSYPTGQQPRETDEYSNIYGLGMLYYIEEDRLSDFWHNGLWCFPNRLGAGGFVIGNVETFTLVLVHDRCGDDFDVTELESGMSEIAYEIFQ